MMNRAVFILPLISVLFLTFASCGQKYFTSDGQAWATLYHIVYLSPRDLADSISKEIEAVNDELSLFNPLSELSADNDGTTDSKGIRLADVFGLSRYVWEISGGVYDPTIGPVAELWGFGRSENAIPTDSAVEKALEAVGMGACSIRGNRIVKKSPATRFDFSSVAKGYGIDCIADMMERNGVENYMIEIGGEVLARGVNPKGRAWHIQIDSPEGGMEHKPLGIKALGPDRTALATSGNYRNIRTDSLGRRYGHTLSPLTGRPAVTSVVSATVESSSCALADALATACMASGCADSAMAIIARSGCEALIVEARGDTLAIVSTPDFKF